MKSMEIRKVLMPALYLLLIVCTAFILQGCVRDGGLRASGLRTEYRVDPLGIGTDAPHLSWIVQSDIRNTTQSAYRIRVAESKKQLAGAQGILWDSGRVESNGTLNIPYVGIPLGSSQRCFWKVRIWDAVGNDSGWSRPAAFETALLQPGDWQGSWIFDGRSAPGNEADLYKEDPAPLFRTDFSLEAEPLRARLYISGLGYYEARLNGRRVGDQVLDPGWTDYADRILYSAYDVTDILRKGKNCLGALLGNGWYNPLPLRMWGRLNLREHLPIGRPCLIAQLEIRFADGSSRTIISDQSWKVSRGPLLRNNIYLGEEYDARREIPGWDMPGFDDSGWQAASPATDPGGRLEAQSQPPVRATEAILPSSISEPFSGVYIVDFGENFAGWVRLRIKAPRGTRIGMRYGELLYPDGTLNPMTSVCGQIKGLHPDGSPIGGPGAPETAVQQDIYICRGDGEEIYTPSFTFHAFRYVEITGHPGRPKPEDLKGIRLHADLETVGEFTCSDPLFNRIQEMTRRTFLSNIFSVQSDCPHRERFGYGGDLAVTADAFMLNFDMAAFYAKAVRDWQDAARPDGMLTDTAPFVGIQYCGLAWALVHPLLQTKLFRWYAERSLIEEQYPISRRWLDLVRTQNQDHLVTDGLSDHEGLEPTPAPSLVTPLYAESARLLGRLAGILKQIDHVTEYQKLCEQILKAYLERFFESGTGRTEPHTQAGQALALGLDLLPPNDRDKALQVLIQMIKEENNGHLTTGIYGTAFLLDVLSGMGQADLAASIVRRNTFPGWGHMLDKGATTLWEHWEFSDNTYSHNHPMFGSVSTWFFQWLAGIQPQTDAVGFDRFLIRPQPVKGLTWVKAEYKSSRGVIRIYWEKKRGKFKLKITIPPNTRAEIFMPTSDTTAIRELGRPGTDPNKAGPWKAGLGCSVCEIGSGTYIFSCPLP